MFYFMISFQTVYIVDTKNECVHTSFHKIDIQVGDENLK